MPFTERDIPDQTGRVALVTGSNAGLGLAIAKGLAAKGADVLMACRNQAKAATAAEQVKAVATGRVEVIPLDLGSLESVAACSSAVLAKEQRLDLLINNAGLMAVDESKTADGFETQIGVNHLGHFALTGQLLPLLLSTPGSRVLAQSSMGHRPGKVVPDDLSFEHRRYNRWTAYFQSKLANLLFSLALQERLAAAGASTIALTAHPGGTRTDLGTEGSGISNKLTAPTMMLGQSPRMGALPTLRAATAPDAKGGEFYGPQFLIMGYPVRERPSRAGRDRSNAAALWTASEHLTGQTYAFA